MSHAVRYRALLIGALAITMGGVVALICFRSEPAITAAPEVSSPKGGRIVSPVAIPAHRALVGQSLDGRDRPAPASPSLAVVLAGDSSLSYAQRLAVIHALPAEFTAEDHATLLLVVSEPRSVPGLSPTQSRAFKNDILNALGRQTSAARLEEIADILRSMAVDPAQEPAMRDYALQHLASLGPTVDDGAIHLAAITGSEPALAATALLHLLARERTGDLTADVRSHVAAAALRLAADPQVPETSRATALQACARLKLAESRPLAFELARSGDASLPLRIAAVAALGDLGGDVATRDYLAALVTGSEKRLRVPAQSALKRFSIN